ncbi:MAG: alkaline phosphatase family protein [Candidatus Sulfotelmatobacter sp.]
MSRHSVLLATALAVGAGILLSFNGCGTDSPVPHINSPISHIVIIFQENRTPDNLFQDPVLIARGADIASSGLNSHGQTIPLTPIPLANKYDLSHMHSAFVAMYDGGKMDGANLIVDYCSRENCLPNPQFKSVLPSDVQPYFSLAEQYTFGDRMFQTNEGPSYPAHQFILSGTSAPGPGSNLFVAENPFTVGFGPVGCTVAASETVALIDPSGTETGSIYPCYEHETLTDLLDLSGATWRYYTPTPDSIWTAPNSIRHMCEPQGINGQLVCNSYEWKNNVVISKTQVLTDIANGELSNVNWVIPTGLASDHAGANNGSGPSWVAQVVNAIGNSPYWANTAIFISWDDWGGWYDHVPPPKVLKDCSEWGCGYVYGFRVPLIVVSPYAKAGYISHVQHDFGSILRFIEEDFGLGSLGYADAYADDLSDCFNYKQTPLTFHTIAAPLDAAYFLNDKTPPTPPDDDD